MRIEHGKPHHQHHRRADQAEERHETAREPAEARAEHKGQVHNVRTGQEMAERKSLVELVRRHPAVPFDNGAASEGQHPAKTCQRHLRECKKKRDQARRLGLDGS